MFLLTYLLTYFIYFTLLYSYYDIFHIGHGISGGPMS